MPTAQSARRSPAPTRRSKPNEPSHAVSVRVARASYSDLQLARWALWLSGCLPAVLIGWQAVT